MSKFLTKLRMEVADNQDDGQWVLIEPLAYQSDIAGTIFVVPAGFQTDLASVPRIPFVYELAGNHANEAAVIHDFLYSTQPVSRSMADAVLREACGESGVPGWRAWMMWAGVRIGGATHWDKTSENLDATIPPAL